MSADGDELEQRRFLALVRLDRKADLNRIRGVATDVQDLLRRWCSKEYELLFQADQGQTFGYLLRTSKPPEMMRAELQRLGSTRNDDAFLIIELGTDFVSSGLSRAATWLQRH